jgi:hypothetical protein
LEEAGIRYWMTFLNGVAGREHSRDHAVNSAKVFSQCKPVLVGTGGLTLFPGTPLLEEARKGEFDPLSESLAVLCQPLNERKNAFFPPHFMKAQNTPLSPVKLPFFGRSDRA